MRITRLTLLTLLTILLALPAAGWSESKTSVPMIDSLHFAAADWCPYTCRDNDHPGFITEAMTAILADYNIGLQVTILPWSRAIKMAEQGKYAGLITAIESEAPDFALTDAMTGQYQVCVFTHKSNNLVYLGRSSMSGVTLGAIQDYGYGEPIDSIVADPHKNEQVYLISSSNPLHSLVEMTLKKRIDAFAEDRMVIANYLNNRENNRIGIRKAGCLQAIPFYTAVSPKHPYSAYLTALLNKLIGSAEYRAYYAQAEQRYGIHQISEE